MRESLPRFTAVLSGVFVCLVLFFFFFFSSRRRHTRCSRDCSSYVCSSDLSLPDLSRDAQRATPNEQLRARIAVGFRRIVFFILPSSLAFVTLAPVIVRPLFQTGRFAAADTELVGGVVAAYGVGLLGQACVKLFQSGFYALRDTKTPVKIAFAAVALSGVLAYVLMRRFGPAGIALGSSLGATVNVVFHLRD